MVGHRWAWPQGTDEFGHGPRLHFALLLAAPHPGGRVDRLAEVQAQLGGVVHALEGDL